MTANIESWLMGRGLDQELVSKLGGGLSPGRTDDWFCLPFLQDGVVVNRKHRCLSTKTFRMDPGAPTIFWNVDVLKDRSLDPDPLIITEGLEDAIAAIQSGFLRTISVPNGAPKDALGDEETERYGFLDKAPGLALAKEIILCTDGDGPGASLMSDLSLRLGRHRCKWVKYPVGCKDLNEVLVKYRAKGVRETVKRAAWCKVDGVYRMSQLPPVADNPAMDCGMALLGNHYKLRLGDFAVFTGLPGSGKTGLINEICFRMAEAHGWNTAFASFEQRQADHQRNLRTLMHGKWAKYQSPEEIKAADAFIEKHFSFIVGNEDDDITLEWMLQRAATAVTRFGAKIVVVDPWNEMDHIRPPGMSEVDYIGYAIKQFRKFARKHSVHMIVAAHPTKMQKGEDGNYNIPSMYDISGAAHWYNKADIGVIVHRTGADPTDPASLIRIAKVKYHGINGMPGDLHAFWNDQALRYTIDTSR